MAKLMACLGTDEGLTIICLQETKVKQVIPVKGFRVYHNPRTTKRLRGGGTTTFVPIGLTVVGHR